MRNLKRFLAMALTMLMVVGCFSMTSFAQNFDDVYDYADAIDVLSDLGVIWGYEDGTFGPDNTVERWHMALWIAKMETGKVTTDDYLTIWRAEANYTDFTDVAVDQAIGAINYAADEGIIIGTSPTTFAPTAGITYQDALTMVVRALGYGSKAMDAGYPWKYINKAAELGLEEGISGIAYTDVLTRAETAQILYNALYTADANGKTYISDVFGLTTVVITGTNNYKIIETESVVKKDYVSFNVLNADGTLNEDVTYHLPAAAFGIDPAEADNYVGASFKVTTDNNFKTIDMAIENPSEIFDAADIIGEGTPAAPNGAYVTLGEDKYDAVTKYTSLYNTQGIKGNVPEIIVYITNAAQESDKGYFKVDSDYNVLDADGKIVAYYRPDITGSYEYPYAKLLGNNAFTTFPTSFFGGQRKAIIAAGGVWYPGDSAEYVLTTNTYDLVKNNKHASAVAYDDNADGVYDRLFYTYQEFCKITPDATTPAVANDYVVNDRTVVVSKFIDGKTGEALAAAPTGYIRYSYNPLSKYLTVYENYTFGTGLVTTVNTVTRKVVIGGTQYTYGIDTYPGATAPQTGVSVGLVGKQVNFILDDGIVVEVFDASVATNYIVFDNLTGLTSAGYATALAYVQSNQASVITIATINGYSYQNYQLLAQQGSLGSIFAPLTTGDLFTGSKDALGFWHLKTLDYTNKHADPTASAAVISFTNGIATTESTFSPAFSQFNTNSDTIYIVYNGTRFYTAKGIPTNESKISVKGGLFVSKIPNTPTANFVYANVGAFNPEFAIRNTTPINQFDAVIYVDNRSLETATNDLGSTGSMLGYTWQYGKVFDMLSGKFISVSTFNLMLEAGKFYTVENGYVEDELVVNAEDLKTGFLVNYSTFSSEIKNADSKVDNAIPYIYAIGADGNVIADATGAPANFAADKSAKVNVPVYFIDGALNRIILTKYAPLASIAVKTPPTKINYLVGEKFDAAGMVITLNYGAHGTIDITKGFTVTPEILTHKDNKVTITYDGKSTTQAITVSKSVTLGPITIAGDKAELEQGDVLTAVLAPFGATASYQWYRSIDNGATWIAINGATSWIYVLNHPNITKPNIFKVVATGTGIYVGTSQAITTGVLSPNGN